MIALIDGDLILYRAGFAAETTYYEIYEIGYEEWGWIQKIRYSKDAKEWINGRWDQYAMKRVQEPEPLENGIYNIKQMMRMIITNSGADSYRAFLSGKDNYRDLVATIQVYKGNRDPSRKPFYYKELKQYLIDQWGAEVTDGYEADDAMSMAQYKSTEDTIICTLDKDLDMCEGLHYNWVRDERYKVTTIIGLRFFYKQLITGDSTDNIPGLFRLTKTKATKKILTVIDDLSTAVEMWNYVVSVYKDSFSSLERQGLGGVGRTELQLKLVEIARLLHMSRSNPDDFEIPT